MMACFDVLVRMSEQALRTATNLNPVANISVIRKARWVMKNGVIYLPSELYTELGIREE
jgi:hypothetical protein